MENVDPQEFGRLIERVKNIHDTVLPRLETKMDNGFGEQREINQQVNGRVRKLENWRWYVLGFAGAITFGLILYVQLGG